MAITARVVRARLAITVTAPKEINNPTPYGAGQRFRYYIGSHVAGQSGG